MCRTEQLQQAMPEPRPPSSICSVPPLSTSEGCSSSGTGNKWPSSLTEGLMLLESHVWPGGDCSDQGRSERECLCQCLVLLLRVFLFACKQMLSLCLHIVLGELIQCLCGGSKGLRTLTWEWRLQHLLKVSVPNGLLIPKIASLVEHKMRCSWNRSSTVASESYNLHVF